MSSLKIGLCLQTNRPETIPEPRFFMMKKVYLLIPLFIFCSAIAEFKFDPKPNVLVLFIDDMGYADPSCFGNPLVKTKNIDRLAKEGLRLRNFYVNSPICSASRTALCSGQYQQRWAINSFLHTREANQKKRMANYLDTACLHTAQIFKNAGYRTAHFGKWHMGGGRDIGEAPLPTEYGFEESLVSFEGLGDRVLFENGVLAEYSEKLGNGNIIHLPKRETTRLYVDKSIDFLKRIDGDPFYLEVFPNDVHDPFLPEDRVGEQLKRITSNPEEQKFLAVLLEMDRQIGRLLDYLDASGLSENTIVIFTSDNGPTDWPRYYKAGTNPPGFTGPFFGRKWSLWEGGIRMPFIIRWPNKVPADHVDDTSIVAAFDLQQSLLQMAGIDAPAGKAYDGEDRSGVFLGEPSARANPLFWEYGAYGSLQPGYEDHRSPFLAMRDGDWKLLVNPDGSSAQLYNLKTDPGERKDKAGEHSQKVEEMSEATLKWWAEMEPYFKP